MVTDSLPDSQFYEPTQVSQVRYSQTQNTQYNSQVEPRRKYWAIFIPLSSVGLLRIPWSKEYIQIGRGHKSISRNDIVLPEKRVSNVHCRIVLGARDDEPDVWVEDRKSSNGTFVNGIRIQGRQLLQHGDELSLGHAAAIDGHDVRWVYRSVGGRGEPLHPMVFDRYQITKTLGKGSFAEVKRAVEVATGAVRAIKQISKHRFAGNKKTMDLFYREIDICGKLTHEHICRLIEYFEDPQHMHLVLEYVDGGDLLDYIMEYPGRGLPEDEAARFTFEICSAMAYTHEMGVTHRDLKPENILLMRETADSPMIVKIADFGLAKMVSAGTMLVSLVGTPQYLAPEVVMQTQAKPGYENKVDCWAVGIIVYSMLTKALPFDEDPEMAVDQRIRARFTQPFDQSLLHELQISDSAVDFIHNLLAKIPEDRLSMAEALEHNWLADPSSQPFESQRLGGDSAYSVESFSEDEDWSRAPSAMSDSLRSGSHDSFSQPLGNLQLGPDKRKSSRELEDRDAKRFQRQ